jgi:hypothetical protein
MVALPFVGVAPVASVWAGVVNCETGRFSITMPERD